MVDSIPSSFIDGLPKVELHLHLETSLRLRRLLERGGQSGPPPGQAHLVADPSLFSGYDRLRRLRYAGRATRIADGAYSRANIAAITAELLTEVAAQGVRHVEIRVGGRRGFALLGVRGMLEAMAEGAASVAHLGLSWGFIITLVRERGPEEADRLVAEAAACRDCGVVGVDLAGDEENYPPALYAAAIGRARDAGLGITVHAGEFAGPAGIWSAVYHLGATRIGHGIRAVEDPHLLDRLRTRGVTLELCPTSNVRLGLVPGLTAHPIKALLAAGVPVTVNSDDPLLLGTTLTRELSAVARAHRLAPGGVVELLAAAARAAFLPAEARAALEGQIRAALLLAGGPA
ncbi:MAG: adenosine deaminase [Armatimonadota bacterium]|nr:adenosine deaminase [Armatimonadota bacterium]MDR7518528.1 adenosine deaminase [Armatimonadota bacterium]